MKLIDYTQFAALPEGTLFTYLEPNECVGVYRKGATIYDRGMPIDYFEETGGGGVSRWGLFEYDQQYAVYEPDDIAALASMLPAAPAPEVDYHTTRCAGCGGAIISRLCSCGTPHPDFVKTPAS